jgi:hypothetical protein
MAKKVEIEVDVKGNVVESTANLRKLKAALKDVTAGTAEWSKIKNQIRDVEDSLESAGQASEDFKGLLENAPGPLGVLGKGIKSVELATKSWGAALKATGIGLLVSLIGGLVAAFSQSEVAMKKLQPLWIGLEKILGGIFRALEPVLDIFVNLAMETLPYVTNAIGGVYSAFMGFFTLVKTYALGTLKVLKGMLTLDFDTLKEGVADLTGMFGKAWDKTKETYGKFQEGTKEMTKTEKENQKARQEAADAAAKKAAEAAQKAKEAAQKAFDEKLKRMEAEDKLDEARLKKLKAEAMAIATTEQEKLDVEKRFAELSYNALLKDIEDKQKLYNKNSLDYKNLQTEKINAEAAYTESLTGFKEKQAAIDKDAADKAKEALKKKQEEEREIIAIGLESQIADLDKKNAIAELDFQQDLDRLKEKRALLDEAEANELANTELTEAQRTEIRQKYADRRKDITNQEIATEKAAADAKLAIQNAYLDAFAQLGSLLQQIAGKNKALAIAGLVVEQAAGVARIIVNTAAANAKAVAASPVTFGQPWVTINTISAGLSIASAIAATAKGIQQINSASSSSNAPSGGGAPAAQNLGQNYADGGLIGGRRHAQGGTLIEAEQGEAIMTRGAVTMFAPMLSMMNQMGGGTAFNRNAMVTLPDNPLVTNPAQEQNPLIMKTYVVENELTSMQQRQARLKDLSTL